MKNKQQILEKIKLIQNGLNELSTMLDDYPLKYDNLVNGSFYVTFYEKQGEYIFKQGYNLWKNKRGDVITSNNGNFTPQNGFHKFRLATKEEINLLSLK